MTPKPDFSIFSSFLKGINTYGLVLKNGYPIKNEKKKHLNNLLLASTNLERLLHQSMGPEKAAIEDEGSCVIVTLVERIFSLSYEDQGRFFTYVNQFRTVEENEKTL